MPKGKKRLGKGLEALLPSFDPNGSEGVRQIPISDIQPNPHQPREHFDEQALAELADSIGRHGLFQPILVSTRADGGYHLVAGERRWRAAAMAGLDRIPAMVKNLDALQMTEVALIENLQREDLNILEEAHGYQVLQQTFNLTQEQIAERVGKSRPQVANTLRMLHLDPAVQAMLANQEITLGHAKVLLAIADPAAQRRLAKNAAAEGWTVRRLEEALRARAVPGRAGAKSRPSAHSPLDPNLAQAVHHLERVLGTRVALEPAGRRPGGKIIIEYYGDADLERLYDHLTGQGAADPGTAAES